MSPAIAERTGCPAILTMIDVAGTMVIGRAVKDVGGALVWLRSFDWLQLQEGKT